MLASFSASAQDIENMLLHDIKLTVRTCNEKNAGTDGGISISVETRSGDRFFLNNGGNDFQQGGTDYYGLTFTSAMQIKDITRIKFDNSSNDGLCISYFDIKMNTALYPIFAKSFSGGMWIDGNGARRSFTIGSSELRNNPLWSNTNPYITLMCQSPRFLHAERLEAKIEGLVGDLISDPSSSSFLRDLYWGGKNGSEWVEIKRKNSSTISGDLDLKYTMPWYSPDVNVDVDFEMRATCQGGSLDLSASVTKIGILGVSVPSSVVSSIASLFGESIQFGEAISENVPFCPSINVESDGTVSLDWGVFNGLPVMCLDIF